MKKSLLLSGAVFLALATSASAATFSIIGGTAGTIPETSETNEVLENVYGIDSTVGFFGSSIGITGATGGVEVMVEYMGYEAAFANSFTLEGFTDGTFGVSNDVTFATRDPNPGFAYGTTTGDGTPIETASTIVDSSDLNFSFSTAGSLSVGVSADTVNNGDPNTNGPDEKNFFAALSADAKTVFLFFDDTGAGDDDNHDDFVVTLNLDGASGNTPPTVPLPAGGLLMIGSLGALAVARRRKVKA